MAEYKLSFTASQVQEKLGKIDSLATKSEIPTATSDLTNDSGFATETYVQEKLDALESTVSQLSEDVNKLTKGDATYTNVLDAVGYKEGYRLGGSTGEEVQNANTDISGFIPFSDGDRLYLKNVQWVYGSSDYTGFVGVYLADKSFKLGYHIDDNLLSNSTYNIEKDENGYVTAITFSHPDAAYIRISAKNIDETSIITVNEEIVGNATNMNDNNDIPDYLLSSLETGAEAINTALCAAGRNKAAFLFYSDTHWDYSSKVSPALLKYLYKNTGMTKTIFGGDIVNSEASDYDTMSYLWEWRKQIKDLPNHHSVVGNHDDGNSTNNLFSEQYIYGYLMAAEETPDIVYGDNGLYYYIDSPAEKTRYLYLDTGYADISSLSDKQAAFIVDALKGTKSGWHIVVIAHIWYVPDYDQYDVRPVPISGLSTTASSIVTILDNYNSRSGEFADCNAKVEFCIGGHAHIDYDGTTSTGIPIILVETDSWHTRSGLSCTSGTTTEASVNGIVANYDERKITVVRIGRGEGREIVVTENVVKYTNILDTIGYEVDQEYSTSSGVQRASTNGFDLTGWIELTDGETYYLKNFVMPDGVTDRNNTAYYFNSDKTWGGSFILTTTTKADWSPVFGADGKLAQFTVPSGWTGKWLRINCTKIDETSILTRNEPIE